MAGLELSIEGVDTVKGHHVEALRVVGSTDSPQLFDRFADHDILVLLSELLLYLGGNKT